MCIIRGLITTESSAEQGFESCALTCLIVSKLTTTRDGARPTPVSAVDGGLSGNSVLKLSYFLSSEKDFYILGKVIFLGTNYFPFEIVSSRPFHNRKIRNLLEEEGGFSEIRRGLLIIL